MLNTKAFRGTLDVASVYLALLSENWDEGLIEIKSEADFTMLAGFRADTRGMRMWRERMRQLEKLRLVKVFPRGSQEIGFVAMRHPYDLLQKLRDEGKLPDDGMWNLYQSKLREAGTVSVSTTQNVVRLRPARSAALKK